MLPDNTPPESPDEVDLEIEDYPYTGDAITFESLDDAPTLATPKGEPLAFINEMLLQLLLEEVPPSADPIGSRTRYGLQSAIWSLLSSVMTPIFTAAEIQGQELRNKSTFGFSAREILRSSPMTSSLRK
jgi:hypothetical protein